MVRVSSPAAFTHISPGGCGMQGEVGHPYIAFRVENAYVYVGRATRLKCVFSSLADVGNPDREVFSGSHIQTDAKFSFRRRVATRARSGSFSAQRKTVSGNQQIGAASRGSGVGRCDCPSSLQLGSSKHVMLSLAVSTRGSISHLVAAPVVLRATAAAGLDSVLRNIAVPAQLGRATGRAGVGGYPGTAGVRWPPSEVPYLGGAYGSLLPFFLSKSGRSKETSDVVVDPFLCQLGGVGGSVFAAAREGGELRTAAASFAPASYYGGSETGAVGTWSTTSAPTGLRRGLSYFCRLSRTDGGRNRTMSTLALHASYDGMRWFAAGRVAVQASGGSGGHARSLRVRAPRGLWGLGHALGAAEGPGSRQVFTIDAGRVRRGASDFTIPRADMDPEQDTSIVWFGVSGVNFEQGCFCSALLSSFMSASGGLVTRGASRSSFATRALPTVVESLRARYISSTELHCAWPTRLQATAFLLAVTCPPEKEAVNAVWYVPTRHSVRLFSIRPARVGATVGFRGSARGRFARIASTDTGQSPAEGGLCKLRPPPGGK